MVIIYCLFIGTDGVLGLSEVTENKLIWRMVVAEFLGTLLLVLIGCGSIVLGETNFLRIGLTFGLTIATLAQVSFYLYRNLLSI